MPFHLEKNKSLKPFSTFGIGGVAHYFVKVTAVAELQEVLQYCSQKRLPFHVIGRGSNSLFSDHGFKGLVILNRISFCDISYDRVSVGGGFNFSLLGIKTAKKGLSGLEFASGIPASVGGAIYMNAGANGKETGEYLSEVTFVNQEGIVETYSKKELIFSYRYSSFQEKKGVIAKAVFHLIPSNAARTTQIEIINARKTSQPINSLSCGCVFRNPLGEKAGILIEKCGLKGKRVGDAEVSSKHANFIINRKNAQAKDVLELVQIVKETVQKNTGIELEMELKHIPPDPKALDQV